MIELPKFAIKIDIETMADSIFSMNVEYCLVDLTLHKHGNMGFSHEELHALLANLFEYSIVFEMFLCSCVELLINLLLSRHNIKNCLRAAKQGLWQFHQVILAYSFKCCGEKLKQVELDA